MWPAAGAIPFDNRESILRSIAMFDPHQRRYRPEFALCRLRNIPNLWEGEKKMRWHPIILPVALLGCGLLLSGCVIPNIVAATTTSASNEAKTSGTQVDQAQIDQFQKGVTTASEVEAKLGQPQQTVQNPDGSLALTYTSKSAVGNTQSHVAYARWVGGAETTITTRNVTFVFGSGGKLAETNTTESSLTCKFGHCPG
jgi:outer membrane protein assembly factor BamE (lipoprotein component of BamABCDE complex)